MKQSRSRTFSIPAITCTLFLAPALLRAGVNAWSGGSPDDPSNIPTIVAASSSDPYVVYAASYGNLSRSDDGGRTWTSLGSFDGVSAVLTHPTSPSTLWLAATDQDDSSWIYKSVDRGLTWTRTPMPEGISMLTASHGGSTLYASASNTVYKSTDGGAGWSVAGHPYIAVHKTIETLVIDPTNDAAIYIGGEEWGREFEYGYYYPAPVAPAFSRSTNGGTSWDDLSSGVKLGVDLGRTVVKAISVDPANPSTILVGLAGLSGASDVRLLRSTDAGISWAPATSGLPLRIDVYSIARDPHDPSTIYAGTESGVYRSRDGGTSWSELSQELNGVAVYSLAAGAGGRSLHAATVEGTHDIEIGEGALDVASGAAGQDRVLYWNAGRMSVRTLDSSGNWTSSPAEGPFASWNATAIGDGSDGLSRVLWQAGNGRVGLELIGPEGSVAAFHFAARHMESPIDLSVTSDGRTHLLWTRAGGMMHVVTVDLHGTSTGERWYGPYPGWSALAIADGPEGASWVLWRKTDGAAGVARYREGILEASFHWSASSGWSAEDVAVGADGRPRVLWTNPDGRAGISTVDAQGQLTARAVYASAGQRARRIAASSDGSTRVLWTAADGSGALWILNPDNSVRSQHPTPGP